MVHWQSSCLPSTYCNYDQRFECPIILLCLKKAELQTWVHLSSFPASWVRCFLHWSANNALCMFSRLLPNWWILHFVQNFHPLLLQCKNYHRFQLKKNQKLDILKLAEKHIFAVFRSVELRINEIKKLFKKGFCNKDVRNCKISGRNFHSFFWRAQWKPTKQNFPVKSFDLRFQFQVIKTFQKTVNGCDKPTNENAYT